MDRESIDRRTRHVSSVQRHENMLENMSPEEADSELRQKQIEVTERWASCNSSFQVLFTVLNGSTAKPIDLFDVKVGHESQGDANFEQYLKVWKDPRDNKYKVRTMVRIDGHIEDHDFKPIESFGDTYEYRFGTTHSHSATIKMKDMDGGGIKLERKDGYLVNGLTRHEMAILLSAIDDMIMPSLDDTISSLALLWDSIQNEEWNPTYARAYRDYQDRWS